MVEEEDWNNYEHIYLPIQINLLTAKKSIHLTRSSRSPPTSMILNWMSVSTNSYSEREMASIDRQMLKVLAKRWVLTNDPDSVPPHPDDILGDREVPRLVNTIFYCIQETSGVRVTFIEASPYILTIGWTRWGGGWWSTRTCGGNTPSGPGHTTSG